MRNFWFILLVALLAAGCSSSGDTGSDTPADAIITALTCEQIEAAARVPITCLVATSDAVLLQLPAQMQLTLRVKGIVLTFDSTIYWRAVPGERMIVAPLEGVSVVGVAGMTYIIHPGEQIALPLDKGILGGSVAPSALQPYDQVSVLDTPYNRLPRSVLLPVPIAAPVEFAVATLAVPSPATTFAENSPATAATADASGCTPREDWVYFYTIQRGDTLTRIAGLHKVTVAELQEGNCITNPNRINPGKLMRVPIESDYTLSVTEAPAAQFYADEVVLQAGDCTILHWQVTGAGVVYLEGDPVAQAENFEVCPTETTTYTLDVYYLDGALVDYTIAIEVVE